MAAPVGPSTGAAPLLVLHFDVNKTIVMSDSCQGYSVAKVVGEVLGRAVHGTTCSTDGWVWNGQEPSTLPPGPGQISYMDWLQEQRLGYAERDRRLVALGQPGDAMAGIAACRRMLEDSLRLPDGEVGDTYRAMFEQGSFPATQPWRFVVSAFFRLVLTLSKRGRQFAVVFRTFGTDIDSGLCQEINAFAEGMHPLYPDAGPFNGTGGRPDLRISLDDPTSHGSFYRDHAGTHLVLGTLTRPPPDNGVSEIGLRHFEGSGFNIVSGHAAINAEIASLTAQHGIIALRDYWPWWGTVQSEKAEAGKPFYVDLADRGVHPMFFDDKVDPEDAHIVDARDPSGSSLAFSAVAGIHLFRSEPFDCLSDPDYFVKCVDAAEERRRQQLTEIGASM